jgi:hypothetical protein
LSDLSGLWGVWHATTRAANGMEWAAARLMAGRRLTGRILEYAACVRHMAVGCAICLVARRREALQPTEDHTAKISASLIGQHPLSGTKAVRPICAAFTAYFRHPRFGRHGPQSTIAATPGIRLGSPSSARIRDGSTGCSEEAEADATIPSIASASSADMSVVYDRKHFLRYGYGAAARWHGGAGACADRCRGGIRKQTRVHACPVRLRLGPKMWG